ncbi:MAG: hypothetical protein ACREVG_15765 [Burkholderiales bacterium]
MEMQMPGRNRMFCRDHGEAGVCLVCVHLQKGRSLGFHAAQQPSTQPGFEGIPEAWCGRCQFFSKLPRPIAGFYGFIFGDRLRVCEHCLELIRIGNEQPGRAPGWWER